MKIYISTPMTGREVGSVLAPVNMIIEELSKLEHEYAIELEICCPARQVADFLNLHSRNILMPTYQSVGVGVIAALMERVLESDMLLVVIPPLYPSGQFSSGVLTEILLAQTNDIPTLSIIGYPDQSDGSNEFLEFVAKRSGYSQNGWGFQFSYNVKRFILEHYEE